MKKVGLIIFLVLFLLLLSGDLYYQIYVQTNLFDSTPNTFCLFDRSCTIHVHPDWSECELTPTEIKEYDFNDSKVMAINWNWRLVCSGPQAPKWYSRPSFYYLGRSFPQPRFYRQGEDITNEIIRHSSPSFFDPGYADYVQCVDYTCQKVLE